MGIFLLIFGALAIAAGIFGKTFYKADVVALGAFKEKWPTWFGRLLFIVVGVVLIAVGIKLLVDAE
jgi:putative Mn2+ efflux pump MntP